MVVLVRYLLRVHTLYNAPEGRGMDPSRTINNPAEYRLTTQVDGHGVYSFCMCPGGIVVPSASAPGEVVINGMSAAGRNSRWSNAAIVVEVRPEDVAGKGGPSGLAFREELEKKAYREANGDAAATVTANTIASGSSGHRTCSTTRLVVEQVLQNAPHFVVFKRLLFRN